MLTFQFGCEFCIWESGGCGFSKDIETFVCGLTEQISGLVLTAGKYDTFSSQYACIIVITIK